MKTLLLAAILFGGHSQGWYQIRATPLQFQPGYGNQFDLERAAALTRRSQEIFRTPDELEAFYQREQLIFGYQ